MTQLSAIQRFSMRRKIACSYLWHHKVGVFSGYWRLCSFYAQNLFDSTSTIWWANVATMMSILRRWAMCWNPSYFVTTQRTLCKHLVRENSQELYSLLLPALVQLYLRLKTKPNLLLSDTAVILVLRFPSFRSPELWVMGHVPISQWPLPLKPTKLK